MIVAYFLGHPVNENNMHPIKGLRALDSSTVEAGVGVVSKSFRGEHPSPRGGVDISLLSR